MKKREGCWEKTGQMSGSRTEGSLEGQSIAEGKEGREAGAAARQDFLSSSENRSGMRTGQGKRKKKEGAVRTERGTK